MTLFGDYLRVSRQFPCPVCTRRDWCLISKDDPANPSSAICARIESPIRWKDAGWFHKLRENGKKRKPQHRRSIKGRCRRIRGVDFDLVSADFCHALRPCRLEQLSRQLCVSVEAMEKLGVGWASGTALRKLGTKCSSSGAWAFPMRGADGRTRGFRLRTEDGFKYSLKGGNEGLHIPEEISATEMLLLSEGPSDTAALLDLGFTAIGRPSCNGGHAQIIRLVRSLSVKCAVVVSDSDEPGRRGARSLANVLLPHCASVRIVEPPPGIEDVRAWKIAGATFSDVSLAIENLRPLRLSIAAPLPERSD